jgi:hypothetical protein
MRTELLNVGFSNILPVKCHVTESDGKAPLSKSRTKAIQHYTFENYIANYFLREGKIYRMTGLDRPLELQEVEVPIISTVYGISSPMHRSHLLQAE